MEILMTKQLHGRSLQMTSSNPCVVQKILYPIWCSCQFCIMLYYHQILEFCQLVFFQLAKDLYFFLELID